MSKEWKKVRLEDVCDISAGGTPSRSKKEYWHEGNIPWVKIGDMNNKCLCKTTEYITELGLSSSSAKMFEKGTILFSIFASLGIVSILDIDATTNQAIAGLKIKDSEILDRVFLYYFLISIKKDIERIGRGVAQNNINLGVLRSYNIAVPPISKQQEIAAILDKASELVEKRKAQLAELDTLAESIFYDMFGDPVTNEKGWEIMPIGELCKVTSSKRIYHSQLQETGVPFYKISDLIDVINQNTITASSYISEELYHDLYNAGQCPKKGDVLVTSRGTLGKCYTVTDSDKFYFQDGMISWLILNYDLIDNQYLKFAFTTNDIKKQIDNNSNGATVNYLSIGKLRELKVTCPPLSLQQQFAQRIEKIEAQKQKVKATLKESEELFQRLMQDLFRVG